MLQPDFINKDVSSLSSLLCQIDERLTLFGKNKWINLTYDADKYYNKGVVELLIFYKRILTKRIHNCHYADCVNIEDIKSRVTILLNK